MLIGLLAGILAFGAWTGAVWHYAATNAVEGYQQKQEVAQAALDAKDKQLQLQAAKAIEDNQNAYDEGQKKAKTIYVKVQAKGANYVANTPVFNNPVCVVPDDGMLAVNSARSGMLAAAATEDIAPAVQGTRADPGRKAVDPVPAVSPRQRPVAGVHPKPRPLN